MNTEKPTPYVKDKQKKPLKDHNKVLEIEVKEKEFGGFENRPEPTRFGDWEVNGRCSDF